MAVLERIGLGYDLHRLEAGRRLVLAGVQIPYPLGLAGHSDADVVIHALIDAMFGAAGLDDIGQAFPDTDPAYKDIDSKVLLQHALEKIAARGFVVLQADVTIIVEKPRLSQYKQTMRQQLRDWLNTPEDAVTVKAKTNEGLGYLGAGQAIACLAVVGLGRT